jgi:hypothetical protein
MPHLRSYSVSQRSSMNLDGRTGSSHMIPLTVMNDDPNSISNNNNSSNINTNIDNNNTNNINTNNTNQINIIGNPQQQQLLQQQFDEAMMNPINMEWIQKPWIQRLVRFCALCSFISICANTPETIKSYNIVLIFTYVVDVIVSTVFTIEMVSKIKINGLFRGKKPYLFDRWCQFDGIMVIFHLISVILQVTITNASLFIF